MTKDDIKAQIIEHWPTNVKNHYSISLTTLYSVFPSNKTVWNRGNKKIKVPDDWLTLNERRNLFYKAVEKPMLDRADNFRRKHESKLKTIDTVDNYQTDVVAPEYNGPFKQFFNRF